MPFGGETGEDLPRFPISIGKCDAASYFVVLNL